MRVSDFGDILSNILRALANRLTAAENFGPEGQRGQVLTSNGPGPDDPPPSYQDIQSIISGNPAIAEAIKGDPGEKGDKGDKGDTGDSGGGGVPLEIELGNTFTVPTNIQMTYGVPIFVSGSLVVDGALTFVD